MTRRRQRVCDAPGCDVPVTRGILMCRPHWFALPRPLREAINESWRAGRIRDWSANCLEARSYLAATGHGGGALAAPHPTAAQAYAETARRMGERK